MSVGKKSNIRYYVQSHARKHFDNFIKKNKYTLIEFYEELSKYTGVSASTIAQMRLRDVAPSYIVAQKVAEFIGLDVNEIWEIIEHSKIEVRPLCEVVGCNNTAGTHGLCMYHVNLRYRKNN